MVLTSPWNTEPDFINEEGVKWWLDKPTTDYAHKPDWKGRTLDATVFYVEETNGHQSRVIIYNGQAEYGSQRLEDIAVHIDMMKITLDRSEE